MIPIQVEHILWFTFLKRVITSPLCQSSSTAPNVHTMLHCCANHDSPTSPRVLRNSGQISPIPWGLANKEFFDHLGYFRLGDTRARLSMPCILTRRQAGVIEVFKVFFPPIHNIASQGQQHTISIIDGIDGALLPPSQNMDGGPELFQSHLELFSWSQQTTPTPRSLPRRPA